MCEPTLILSAAVGGLQAVTTYSQQKAAWRDQIKAIDRSNLMARQDYINKLNIASHNDQLQGRQFQADLKAAASSKSNYYKQLKANQVGQIIADEAEQNKLAEKIKKASFESNQRLAESVRAQGTILAGSSPTGGSLLSQIQQVDREYGIEEAQISAQLFDATRASAIARQNVNFTKYSADTRAHSDIYTGPQMAPSASFGPIVPIKQSDPSAPSPFSALLQGATTAVSVYGGTAYEGRTLGRWKTGPV